MLTCHDDISLAGENLLGTGGNSLVGRYTCHGDGGGWYRDGDTSAHASLASDVGGAGFLDHSAVVQVVDQVRIDSSLVQQTLNGHTRQIDSEVVTIGRSSQGERNSTNHQKDLNWYSNVNYKR